MKSSIKTGLVYMMVGAGSILVWVLMITALACKGLGKICNGLGVLAEAAGIILRWAWRRLRRFTRKAAKAMRAKLRQSTAAFIRLIRIGWTCLRRLAWVMIARFRRLAWGYRAQMRLAWSFREELLLEQRFDSPEEAW